MSTKRPASSSLEGWTRGYSCETLQTKESANNLENENSSG